MPIVSLWRRTFLSAAILSAATTLAPAADQVVKAPVPIASPAGPQTFTGDWFGQGPAMRDAGFDFRLEWSQFYQGTVGGRDSRRWFYGGKWDAQARVDLSKVGFWDGLSFTVQGTANYARSINDAAGTAIPVNAALYFPGIEGADASDIMALYLQQNFGMFSVLAGKLNLIEFTRATPLRGGGGVDTFWNANLATPITGLTPPTVNGAQLRINTQPVSFSFTVFDPLDATNRPLFEDLFKTGVSVMATATYSTRIAGLTGNYGIKGIYTNKEGPDLSSIIPPPGVPFGILNKKGSYYVGFSFQQFLVQDPNNPARGWGVFGELTKADGNPNTLEWSTYFGVGGNGIIPSRPDDRFGIAYFRYGASKALKNELASVFPLTDESGVELFYNAAVTPWFRLSGNLQFVRSAIASLPWGTYAGISSYVRF